MYVCMYVYIHTYTVYVCMKDLRKLLPWRRIWYMCAVCARVFYVHVHVCLHMYYVRMYIKYLGTVLCTCVYKVFKNALVLDSNMACNMYVVAHLSLSTLCM
jgi:hypothetical protein